MKAMILAAGLGTRLRPLTEDRPKALVEVGGRTLLEITLRRLRSFGIQDVILNVHHFADMVVAYLKANGDFGMRIAISREDQLLDTGGGLKKAADFFLQGDGDEPFLLHNVDVLSAVDLAKMVKFHREQNALATLAVQQRKSSRYLLFDAQMQLCGRLTAGETEAEMVCAAAQADAWAFAGIHVLSPRIFELMDAMMGTGGWMSEGGGQPAQVFSIIPVYLRLAGGGEKMLGFRADGSYWRDLGTSASLQQAAEDIERKLIEL
jgi:NDP-sugar pyrophosphorylase family protein